MWEPRPLTILWASTACYRDSFTFLTFTELTMRTSPWSTVNKRSMISVAQLHSAEWLHDWLTVSWTGWWSEWSCSYTRYIHVSGRRDGKPRTFFGRMSQVPSRYLNQSVNAVHSVRPRHVTSHVLECITQQTLANPKRWGEGHPD
jgi:hypothetical protein